MITRLSAAGETAGSSFENPSIRRGRCKRAFQGAPYSRDGGGPVGRGRLFDYIRRWLSFLREWNVCAVGTRGIIPGVRSFREFYEEDRGCLVYMYRMLC